MENRLFNLPLKESARFSRTPISRSLRIQSLTFSELKSNGFSEESEERNLLSHVCYTQGCAGSVSIASHTEQIKLVTGKEPAFHETFRYWHVSRDPSNSIKSTKKICQSSAFVDNKSAKTMENYLKKKAESEEAVDVFNPQHWLESSGGLTKGKMYGAPHIDISSLHRGSQSSMDSHQRYTPQPPTQPLHTPFSLEQVGQWVLEKLRQSSDIPIQATIPMQTTIPMNVTSSQPTVPMSPPSSAQPSMFTQAGMPTQSPQMGFSPLPAAFSHMTGNMSMPVGAYPSQQSPLPSNTFGIAQQNIPFFDLLQQQYPYMPQFSHLHQASQPAMTYQQPHNFEEGRHDEGAQ